MMVKLKQIASVRAGFTFRGKSREVRGSGIKILQIKDIRDTRVINGDALPEIEWQGKATQLLQREDIAIAARGIHNTAAIFQSDKQNQQIVPSNQLLIISPKDSSVLPDYLCWALNYPRTQQQLQEVRAGTNIASINKSHLLDLSIPLPAIEVQQKIIWLYKLREQERALQVRLETNRDTMLKGMYQQLLKEDDK